MRMPTAYVPPFGSPLYWRDEESGDLARAMKAFVAHSETMESTDLALVIAYFRYYILAPCWQGGGEIGILREEAHLMQTAEQVHAWIGHCMASGIDPI